MLRRAAAFEVVGVDCARAESYLRTVAADLGGGASYALHLDEVIPGHAGLGSGTQLALAIGAGVATLEGVAPDLRAIAARLGRGKRSGIGVGTFGQGGAVLDCGPGAGTLPPVLCRLLFPPEWRVLLIFDLASAGIHGADEVAAFAAVPDFPEARTAELCRRLLLGALPALAESDFKRFCAEIGYLQACMADYFAPLQGGPYASSGVAELLDWLAGEGVTGIGQSSWGPTGFAFAESEAEGEALLAHARARARGSPLRLELARARNRPAIIEPG
jgi:beta-ribofuranosylaminobenzene 5'-phosphate synthase